MSYDTRLDDVCRANGLWMGTPHPGMCWIMDNVMKVDPGTVREQGVDHDGYDAFATDQYGNRLYNADTLEPIYMRHEWTDEEKAKLDEWDDFIPTQYKVKYD